MTKSTINRLRGNKQSNISSLANVHLHVSIPLTQQFHIKEFNLRKYKTVGRGEESQSSWYRVARTLIETPQPFWVVEPEEGVQANQGHWRVREKIPERKESEGESQILCINRPHFWLTSEPLMGQTPNSPAKAKINELIFVLLPQKGKQNLPFEFSQFNCFKNDNTVQNKVTIQTL